MLIAFVIVLAVATLGILLVMVVSLIRQVGRLAAALVAFQGELKPVLEEIRRDADRAGSRLQSLSERRAAQGSR